MARQDQSYGVIPLRSVDGAWEALMVCHRTGYWWSFPKGHAELDERPQTAAARELQEETGLTVTYFLDCPSLYEAYQFRLHGEVVNKRVTYFMAEVDGGVCLQEEELVDAEWVPLADLEQKATYSEGKALCRHIAKLLKHGGNVV